MNTITSFLAGIMAFIGSLFGQSVQAPVQPVAQYPAQQVSSNSEVSELQTASSSTATSTSSKLKTYRSDLFGYEIQYPDAWNIHSHEGTIHLDDPKQKNSKNEPSTVLSISAHYFNLEEYKTLNDWAVGAGYMLFGNKPGQSTGLLNGKEIKEITVDKCGKNIATLHGGMVFLFSYTNLEFDICESDLSAIKSVIASFKVVTPKTQQDIAQTTYWLDSPYYAFLLKDNKTDLVNNDLVKTIETGDHGYSPLIVYTTKDSNKTYFVACKETLGGCAWAYLKYLDRKDKRFYSTNVYYGNDVLQSDNFLVVHGDDKKIFIFDFEKGRGDFVYLKNNSESYVSACGIGDFGDFSLKDIEFTNDGRLRIGVYKNVGQEDDEKCLTDAKKQSVSNFESFKYEKIRDDYVDLTKF